MHVPTCSFCILLPRTSTILGVLELEYEILGAWRMWRPVDVYMHTYMYVACTRLVQLYSDLK
jgi:hypothetical protein